MKTEFFISILSASWIVCAAASSTRARLSAFNYAKLNQKELEEFANLDGVDLAEWLAKKRVHYGDCEESFVESNGIPTSSSNSSFGTTDSAGNSSPDVAKESSGNSSPEILESEQSTDSPVTTESPKESSGNSSPDICAEAGDDQVMSSESRVASNSPKVSFNLSPSDRFEQKLLISMNDAIENKNFGLTLKFMKSIRNWKMTASRNNFSVLSLIYRNGKGRFNGRLNHPQVHKIFDPLFTGKNYKLATGYLAALSLFKASVQAAVIQKCIDCAPHLRGVLLQVAIYYRLHESVIRILLDSGPIIRFHNDYNVPSPLHTFPSMKGHTQQVPSRPNFFMNFFCQPKLNLGITKYTSPDAEINFLYGMVAEDDLITEIGSFRVAFETYSAQTVLSLMNLSPYAEMTKYHLAHLLALYPEKQDNYPNIDTLVDSSLLFERLSNGESDIIALAYLSKMNADFQIEAIENFLTKTRIFLPATHHQNDGRFIVKKSSEDFAARTGIYELPSAPSHILLLTACKWNITDTAFEMIFDKCKLNRTRNFFIASGNALKWAQEHGSEKKIEILSRK